MSNEIPISKSPTLKPRNLSQRISKWSPACADRQTLTGDPPLPRTGILPPLATVAKALHKEPINTRKICGLFFLGLFSQRTTAQKPMQQKRFGHICQIILARMISTVLPGSSRPRAMPRRVTPYRRAFGLSGTTTLLGCLVPAKYPILIF